MASRGINKVIIVGNLGQDPEVRYSAQGSAIANITVATSESWRDKASGEERQKTEWHRVAIFGKLAEVAGEYLRKGSQVYLEGQLQTRKYEKDGQDRYTTEVVVQGFNGVMQMLGSKQEGGQRAPQPSSQSPTPPNQPPSKLQQPARSQPNQWPTNNEPNNSAHQFNEPPMDYDDDIPFASIGLMNRNLLNCM